MVLISVNIRTLVSWPDDGQISGSKLVVT